MSETFFLKSLWTKTIFSVFCFGNCGVQCEHNIYNMSSRSKEDPGHQAALPRDDCQEHEEVLHIRGPGPGR